MKNDDSKKCPVTHLTTDFGAPVPNNRDSLSAGARGPLLAQDVWLNEKLANFVREVIPERRMHAKGSGAFGTFTVTKDITKYTRAKLFEKIGKKTEMFARFTTVAGERGAADAERDIRGFALKFYTEEGNWDMVGNNTPVFFIRDPRQFPDLNKAVKRDPKTNLRCPVHSNHRDGTGRADGNYGGTPHYEPNSFGQWQAQAEFSEPPLKINGDAQHWSFHNDDSNYFEQPRKLFQLMNGAQKEALFGNTARGMGDAAEFVKFRHIRNCHAVDPAYAAGVAKALGVDLQKALASQKDDQMYGNPLVALPV